MFYAFCANCRLCFVSPLIKLGSWLFAFIASLSKRGSATTGTVPLSFSDLFVFAEALGKLHFGHVYGKSSIGVRREHTIGVSLHFQPCPSGILPEGLPPWATSLFFDESPQFITLSSFSRIHCSLMKLHSSLLCRHFHVFISL